MSTTNGEHIRRSRDVQAAQKPRAMKLVVAPGSTRGGLKSLITTHSSPTRLLIQERGVCARGGRVVRREWWAEVREDDRKASCGRAGKSGANWTIEPTGGRRLKR